MTGIDTALSFSTSNERIDEIVRGVITIFGGGFPGRLRSCYLFGSYVDGSPVTSSDLDLFIVLTGELGIEDEERGRQLARGCGLISPVQLDVVLLGEDWLLREGHFRIEQASALVWGEELRERMPRQTLAAYLCKYSHSPYAYMAQVHRRCDTITYPLDYPKPDDEFFGYDQQYLPPSTNRLMPAHNIEAFVATVCWIASVTVSLRAGRMVRSKVESVRLYRELVGDNWSDFVETVYELGKRRWGYLVPEAEPERAKLRELCRRMPAFENHYLALYRNYLLDQLRHGSAEEQMEAAQRLRDWVRYPGDAEIAGALESLAASAGER